ncbi:Lsr2 protein [Stackebrandtia albiflava]|uniref:Lsr2 protein n=1 Tax=Stackebrandtia albiflava TaxID=406432 RepID=A0A562V1N9_9ACTN|nr:Lsr2 family protein [Stackebrandtia albiflava]TWJ11798.1 Lsr2 protein [Stackebrandtia albiflava]
MAQRVQVILVDDLDGGQAEETVKFGLDGFAYEIDLSHEHAGTLREALADYVNVARKLGRYSVSAKAGTTNTPPKSRAPIDREQNKAIREWAARVGKKISDRGRIAQSIVDEYNASAGK